MIAGILKDQLIGPLELPSHLNAQHYENFL